MRQHWWRPVQHGGKPIHPANLASPLCGMQGLPAADQEKLREQNDKSLAATPGSAAFAVTKASRQGGRSVQSMQLRGSGCSTYGKQHPCLLPSGTTTTPAYPPCALQSDPLTGEVEGVFVTRQLSSDGAWGCEEGHARVFAWRCCSEPNAAGSRSK